MPAPNLAIIVKMSGGLLPANSRAGDVEIYDNGKMLIFESDTDIVERQITRDKVLEMLQFARQSGFFQLENIMHDAGNAVNVPDVTISISDSMGTNTVTMTAYQRLRGEMRKDPFDVVYKRITDLAWETYNNGSAPATEVVSEPTLAAAMTPPAPGPQAPQNSPGFTLPFANQAKQGDAGAIELPSLDDLLQNSGLQFDEPAANAKTPGLPPLQQQRQTPAARTAPSPTPPAANQSAAPDMGDSLPPLNPMNIPTTMGNAPGLPPLGGYAAMPSRQAQQRPGAPKPNQSAPPPQKQPLNQNPPAQNIQPKPKQDKPPTPVQSAPPAQQQRKDPPKQQVQSPQNQPPRPPERPKEEQRPPQQEERQQPIIVQQTRPPQVASEKSTPPLPPPVINEPPRPAPPPLPPRNPEPRPPVMEERMRQNELREDEENRFTREPPKGISMDRPQNRADEQRREEMRQDRPPRNPEPPQRIERPAPPVSKQNDTVRLPKKPVVAWEHTQELIGRLEDALHGKILVYYASDLVNLKISDMRYLYSHLRKLGKKKTLYILPIIPNADISIMWRLATLLREFYDELNVLLPDESSVATTLLALSADKILMNPFGYLSPIETPFSHLLLDKAYGSSHVSMPLSEILAMTSYAQKLPATRTKSVESTEEPIAPPAIHPLVSTAAQRQYALTKMVSTNMLQLSKSEKRSDATIDAIVTQLTKTYPSQHYPIAFFEAQSMGLPVSETTEEVNDMLWELLKQYMYITQPVMSFRDNHRTLEQQGIIVESTGRRTVFYREELFDTKNDRVVDQHDRWRELTMQSSINQNGKDSSQMLWKDLQLVNSEEHLE